MTPPDDSTFWGWAGAVFAGLTGLVFKGQNDKIARVEKQAKDDHKRHDEEIMKQRDHVETLFEKLEAHARRSEDRHMELMTALHQGLQSKADK